MEKAQTVEITGSGRGRSISDWSERKGTATMPSALVLSGP